MRKCGRNPCRSSSLTHSLTDMEEKVDVVIIGGGISGLCAAKLLKEQGVRAIVLEAQDRVGGRTHTVRDPSTYQYTDVGGAYVGPTQRRVARLANELGLEFYKVNKKEKTILYYEGSWAYYKGNVPPVFNIIKACDLNNIQRKLDAMGAEIPLEAPWKAKKAKEWDSMTVKEFLDKNCWTSFSHTMGTLICQGVFCSEAHEMSLLYFLWYIASGRGLTRVTSVTNGAQERKFVGGSMQLSEKIAEIIEEDVHLEQPVIRVEQTEKGAKVTTANNNTYLCDYVISGMPQALLNRVTFAPPLPPEKLQLIQRIPMGSIIKTMIFYEKAFWKENGYCGEMITDTGPVLYCVDDTKPDGSSPCIMGFILAQRARDMTQMSPEQRRDAIAKHYAKVFKMDEFLKPINYIEKNWAAEEYSGGCYVSTMPPGVLTSMGNQLQEPFDRVFFAGTETASDWAGYMEGAVQAGERAARQVLHAKGVLAEHEIYQDEPPCESFPEPPVEVMFIEKVLPSVPTLLAFCGAGLVALAAWGLQKYCDINFSVSWK